MSARLPILREWNPPAPPAECFRRIHADPGAVFLDTGLPMKGIGRFSFISSSPFLTLSSRDLEIRVRREDGSEETFEEDPFLALSKVLAPFALDRLPQGPPFQGGAAGYFAYDLGRRLERIHESTDDDLLTPDLHLGFYDVCAAFDLETGRCWLVSTGLPERGPKAVTRAEERLEAFREAIESADRPRPEPFAVDGELRSNFTSEEYVRAVDRCRRYIIEGDIFQANISQRFEIGLGGSPYSLYEKLREINPAPFAAYLHTPGMDVVSASPERFLLLEGDRVQTRPIKGTRPRGEDKEQDRFLAEELLGSEKDRAENTMIVDLLRNDLGRVCRPGTVRVRELCALETFPTVFHLTSTVTGMLAARKGPVDLLRATFPGGSITGAPKVRAMEIIEELEPTRRSVYTGAIGYLGFSGDMDLNIVIRTILCTGGRAYYQVGGGIVFDSDPEQEYEETLHKGRALAEALGAGKG